MTDILQNRYPIIIDLQNKIINYGCAKFKQGSVGTAVLDVSLIGDDLLKDITGQTITFNFVRTDGNVIVQDETKGVKILDAVNGKFECIIDSSVLTNAQTVKCEIVFSNGSNILPTATFSFIVDSSIGILSIIYIGLVEDKVSEWKFEFNETKVLAQEAINNSNAATAATEVAIGNANAATANTNAAISSANTATSNAVTATSNANTARDNANIAKDNAVTATNGAITAKDNAIIATTNANNATASANVATSESITATTKNNAAEVVRDTAENKRVADFASMINNQSAITSSSIIGTRYNITTDTFIRLGAIAGKAVGQTLNEFDTIMPYCAIRRCNLSDGLIVNAYYGETGYKEDGSNGQVMVEVPAFYYRRYFYDAENIETWISPVALPGYKLHPWFYTKTGVTRNKAYISAFEGSLFDVSVLATEVDTLTVATPCTTSGNIIVRVNSVDYSISVVAGDDVNAVATKIRAVVYAGWTISGSGAIVIFTCNTLGAKFPALIYTNTLGITATVVQTTIGAGGYVNGDAQVADFTATTGDKLCSIAGVKPCSGALQSLTLPNSRRLANNRGSGWEQQMFNAVSAIQMLLVGEYASPKSQTLVGQGVVNKPWRDPLNDSEITGGTSSLGNKSGKAIGSDGIVSVSYRGIENFWGNIWKWVDGFNIKDGVSYISNKNGDFVSDIFTGQYVNAGFVNASVAGYISKVGISPQLDYGFIPTETLGTSSSKYGDYFYLNSVGAFVALLGGNWADGAAAGAFYWFLVIGSGIRHCYIGARLCA